MKIYPLLMLLLVLPVAANAADTFLDADELALLKPDPEVAGLNDHLAPGADLSGYERALVGSVTFYFAPDSRAKDLDAKESTQITQVLRGALESELRNHFELADEPGAGVLLVNVAVTDIKMKNKKRGLLGYTPIGLVATTAADLAGLRLVLAKASLQGEIVDGDTGDVLSLFRVDQVKDMDEKKKLSWDDVRLTLEDFADRALQARFAD